MKLPPKTKKEAAQRLIDGERFEFDGIPIFFDETKCEPFRMDGYTVQDYWHKCLEWQPIQEWHETVSTENPRFCWVSDESAKHRYYAARVVGVKPTGRYEVSCGTGWKFATPVLPEDLEHG